MTYQLITNVTTYPCFSRFLFYVEHGQTFDADDYCAAYGLDPADIVEQGHGSISSTQDAAAALAPGQWLQVDHVAV